MSKVLQEVTNLKWFDIDNIPENLSPPTKPAFKKFVEMNSKKAIEVKS